MRADERVAPGPRSPENTKVGWVPRGDRPRAPRLQGNGPSRACSRDRGRQTARPASAGTRDPSTSRAVQCPPLSLLLHLLRSSLHGELPFPIAKAHKRFTEFSSLCVLKRFHLSYGTVTVTAPPAEGVVRAERAAQCTAWVGASLRRQRLDPVSRENLVS